VFAAVGGLTLEEMPMTFLLRRKLVDFDGYAALKMFQKKAATLEQCRRLWDNETGKKYFDLTTGTWLVEVEVREYLLPGSRCEVTEVASATNTTVYQ